MHYGAVTQPIDTDDGATSAKGESSDIMGCPQGHPPTIRFRVSRRTNADAPRPRTQRSRRQERRRNYKH